MYNALNILYNINANRRALHKEHKNKSTQRGRQHHSHHHKILFHCRIILMINICLYNKKTWETVTYLSHSQGSGKPKL